MTVPFDKVFTDYERSPRLRELFSATLDPALPPRVEPFSFVPLAALRAITQAVAVRADELLVDLGCGRGGPGMWAAQTSGVRLVGMDRSPVAVRQARRRAATFGLQDRAQFVVGDLLATGLASACADGVMCVDAFQFAADHDAAAGEVLRQLRPGRRLALSCWEPLRPGDGSLPARFAHLVFAQVLATAGFTEIAMQEHPEWHDAQRAVYEAALGLDAGSDPGLRSLQREAEQGLPRMAGVRRVLVVAQRPARP
jgi:SAM-dependent methyltransferase